MWKLRRFSLPWHHSSCNYTSIWIHSHLSEKLIMVTCWAHPETPEECSAIGWELIRIPIPVLLAIPITCWLLNDEIIYTAIYNCPHILFNKQDSNSDSSHSRLWGQRPHTTLAKVISVVISETNKQMYEFACVSEVNINVSSSFTFLLRPFSKNNKGIKFYKENKHQDCPSTADKWVVKSPSLGL